MEKIVKYFGEGFLALVAGVFTVAIFTSCVRTGGVLNDAVLGYMNSICG